jgi:CRISPR/Cas system-associated exonuclease Cas4 (RecB family)
VKNYATHVYQGAIGRAPLPTLLEVLTGSPTALGRSQRTGLLGTVALRRLCHARFAVSAKEWLRTAYARHWSDAPQVSMHGLDLSGVGIVNGQHGPELVVVEFDACKGWNADDVPRAVLTSALTKAWAAGCDTARLVYVNQNSLDWSFWSVSTPMTVRPMLVAAAVYAAAEAFAGAYDEMSDSDPAGVNNYPIVSNRLQSEEGRVSDLVKLLSDQESEKRKGGVISPSEISISDCDRRIGYALTRQSRVSKFPPNLYRIFAYGTAIHDVVQGLLQEELPHPVPEVKIENAALNIYGSGDLGDDEERICFELKSMSTHQVKKLRQAKDDHQTQATIYARASARFDVVIYMYIDKETYEIKEFPTKADLKRWHNVVARAERINQTVRNGQLPDRTENTAQCRECPFLWVCKPTEDPQHEPSILRNHRRDMEHRRAS